MSRGRTHRQDAANLQQVLAGEFADNPRAVDLMSVFLLHRHAFDRDFVEVLLGVARSPFAADRTLRLDQAWDVRCLAALMLQQQFLRLPAKDLHESWAFLRSLGLLSCESAEGLVSGDVLKDGYTTTRPVAFLEQFRRQLRRFRRVVSPIGRDPVTARAMHDFIAISRRENCKLSLGRYLFHPDEVAERIRAGPPFTWRVNVLHIHLRHRGVSAYALALAGVRGRNSAGPRPRQRNVLGGRPNQLRAQCARRTAQGHRRLDHQAARQPNRDRIKRAGHRGERPLTIVHDRDGRPLPPSHRLSGGSSAEMLQWEAGSSGCFAKAYWLVHRSAPPIPISTAIIYPNSLPVGPGPRHHLIDYFSDPGIFGDEFPAMRHAMIQSIASFARERGQALSDLQGEWGETLQFFEFAVPAQSILVGSTSFRLQVLSRYLSADGARHYFGEEPGPRASSHEAALSQTPFSRRSSVSTSLRARLMSRTNPTSTPRSRGRPIAPGPTASTLR